MYSIIRSALFTISGLAVLALTMFTDSFAGPVTFFNLGTLSASDSSTAGTVSGDGSVVFGWSANSGGNRAVRWTVSLGLQDLGFNTEATANWPGTNAASFDGSVVVGSLPSGISGFIWRDGLGAAVIPNFDARGLSSDGLLAVGASPLPSGLVVASTWSNVGGLKQLGHPPGGFISAAEGVSGDGSVVVGVFNPSGGGTRAFSWTAAGGFTELADLMGSNTRTAAWAISADGSVIAGEAQTAQGTHAARWLSDGTVETLGTFGTNSSGAAFDVSADGSRIVGRDGNNAFMWTRDYGMFDLNGSLLSAGINLSDWFLNTANEISDDGDVIVGLGTRISTGRQEGFIITGASSLSPGSLVYPPPPNGGGGNSVPDGGATIAMLGTALVGLAALRRRFSLALSSGMIREQRRGNSEGVMIKQFTRQARLRAD